MPIGGIYTGSISYMVGDTGVMMEYFMWASYASVIGMGAAMPIIMRVKMRFKVRNKVVLLLVLLGFLSCVNSTTSQPMVIIFVSLIMGFSKSFITIEVIRPLMTLMGGRGIFYGVFYTFILAIMQVASYYSIEFSIMYNWRQFLVLASILCFALAMICWIFMHEKYYGFKEPLYYIDWFTAILFIATFMLSAYVFVFGKQQDWFNSQKIINASIASFVCFSVMYIRQMIVKKPYLSFKIFSHVNVKIGLFLIFCLGMFLATSSIQNIFSVGVLGYGQLTNAKLSVMMIPGLVAGGALSVYWFEYEMKLKYLIFVGFSSMVAYCMVMYFSMVLEFNYNDWYLPMFLKGFGMCTLYVSVWYFMLDKITPDDMLPAMGLLLLWRTFVTTGFFSAVFSWTQYQFQIESLGDLAVYMDGMTMTSYPDFSMRSVQLNSVIAANKELFGYVILAGFGVLVFILSYHFDYTKFSLAAIEKLFSAEEVTDKRRLRKDKRKNISYKEK